MIRFLLLLSTVLLSSTVSYAGLGDGDSDEELFIDEGSDLGDLPRAPDQQQQQMTTTTTAATTTSNQGVLREQDFYDRLNVIWNSLKMGREAPSWRYLGVSNQKKSNGKTRGEDFLQILQMFDREGGPISNKLVRELSDAVAKRDSIGKTAASQIFCPGFKFTSIPIDNGEAYRKAKRFWENLFKSGKAPDFLEAYCRNQWGSTEKNWRLKNFHNAWKTSQHKIFDDFKEFQRVMRSIYQTIKPALDPQASFYFNETMGASREQSVGSKDKIASIRDSLEPQALTRHPIGASMCTSHAASSATNPHVPVRAERDASSMDPRQKRRVSHRKENDAEAEDAARSLLRLRPAEAKRYKPNASALNLLAQQAQERAKEDESTREQEDLEEQEN